MLSQEGLWPQLALHPLDHLALGSGALDLVAKCEPTEVGVYAQHGAPLGPIKSAVAGAKSRS